MAKVVVGVDGSRASRRALGLGVEEARLRRLDLVAVIAWHTPMVSMPYPIAIDPYEYERSAQHTLDEAVGAVVGEAIDDPVITRRVAKGDARDVLLDGLVADDLLVVGTRGFGGVLGLLLGSVASHCIQHAPCPVLVAPWTESPS